MVSLNKYSIFSTQKHSNKLFLLQVFLRTGYRLQR